MKNGIDVSRHQLTIDWTAVKNSMISYLQQGNAVKAIEYIRKA